MRRPRTRRLTAPEPQLAECDYRDAPFVSRRSGRIIASILNENGYWRGRAYVHHRTSSVVCVGVSRSSSQIGGIGAAHQFADHAAAGNRGGAAAERCAHRRCRETPRFLAGGATRPQYLGGVVANRPERVSPAGCCEVQRAAVAPRRCLRSRSPQVTALLCPQSPAMGVGPSGGGCERARTGRPRARNAVICSAQPRPQSVLLAPRALGRTGGFRRGGEQLLPN